jgi:hypothetical protein
MGLLFSLGSPIVDIHMVKTRLGEEGGGEEESEDSEEDVPLAQRKVARV